MEVGGERDGVRCWCYVVSPCFCCGIVAECVVGEAAVVIFTSTKEGLAAAIPAAVGGVPAGNTPLDVYCGAETGAVVLATSATYIKLQGAVDCPVTPLLAVEAP